MEEEEEAVAFQEALVTENVGAVDGGDNVVKLRARFSAFIPAPFDSPLPRKPAPNQPALSQLDSFKKAPQKDSTRWLLAKAKEDEDEREPLAAPLVSVAMPAASS